MRKAHARQPNALVAAEGHLIDTGLLSRSFGIVIEGGGSYVIERFDVGRTKHEFSKVELEVRAADEGTLRRIIDNLVALGFLLKGDRRPEVELARVTRDGVAPEDFYASTHHRTVIRHGGRSIQVDDQRMDGVVVVKGLKARCALIRDLKRGDAVVVGVHGVETHPPYHEREAESFAFMKSEASSERAVVAKAREVAAMVRDCRTGGKKVIFVPGPVVVHTGGSDSMIRLIRAGFVDGLLTGNALAVHDVERAMFSTSLGVDVDRGVAAAEGHMHHLRAINAVRRAGSLAKAVRSGVLRSGIMHALIEHEVPFVLAGSIRDDGPLPDTRMDLIEAQREYAKTLSGAGIVIVLASMLHGIGVGNMLPSDVRLVCVDIHPSVVTKLADRGSAHALGIVTDVSAFLARLEAELVDANPKRRRRRSVGKGR